MFYGIFVDLIDGHVEADVVGGSMFDVLHNGVVGVTPDQIVPLPVTVQT